MKHKFTTYYIGLMIFTFLVPSVPTWSDEACSRTAIINYQEVLVDGNSTNKGEGLKYYLEKDPVAKSYLDKYQKNTRPPWLSAAIGTTGSALLLTGLFTAKDEAKDDLSSRELMIFGGAGILILNFVIAATLDYNNETHLQKSVDEYNKRNLPRIYFSPFKNQNLQGKSSLHYGVNAGLIQDF